MQLKVGLFHKKRFSLKSQDPKIKEGTDNINVEPQIKQDLKIEVGPENECSTQQ